MTQFPIDYLLAKLWSVYYPLIVRGNHIDVCQVYKQLKQYPQTNPVVVALKEQCLVRFNKWGIDPDYII